MYTDTLCYNVHRDTMGLATDQGVQPHAARWARWTNGQRLTNREPGMEKLPIVCRCIRCRNKAHDRLTPQCSGCNDGRCAITAFSSSQAATALLSFEAELYAFTFLMRVLLNRASRRKLSFQDRRRRP